MGAICYLTSSCCQKGLQDRLGAPLTCEIGRITLGEYILGDLLAGGCLIQVPIKVLQWVAPNNAAHQLPWLPCQ